MSDSSTIKTKFSLIRSKDFLEELKTQTSLAKNRFYAQSMFNEPGVFSDEFKNIFTNLRQKNIECKFSIDYFVKMFAEGDIRYLNFYKAETKENTRNKKDFYNYLKKIGVEVNFLNNPNLLQRIFPYAGRNHSKLVIVDDVCYVGGMNFSDKDLANEDFMIKIESKEITNGFTEIFMDFIPGIKNDKIINFEEFDVLIDAGRPTKSLILKTTIHEIANATTSVNFMNQFSPNGKLLALLEKKRKRGVNVNLIIPKGNSFNIAFNLIYQLNKLISPISKFNIKYFPSSIHSKLLLIDGKTAIFGSHNLVREGVIIGTTELSIMTRNKELVMLLNNYYQTVLKEISNKTT